MGGTSLQSADLAGKSASVFREREIKDEEQISNREDRTLMSRAIL